MKQCRCKLPKQTLAGKGSVVLGSGRCIPTWYKGWRDLPVQQLFWVQECSRCSLDLRSQELTPFPDSSKEMFFHQPPSVICTLMLGWGKTSIWSTWALGATRHSVTKSLHDTPAKVKSDSLDCNCQGSHWLSVCWINNVLPVTQTCQDILLILF